MGLMGFFGGKKKDGKEEGSSASTRKSARQVAAPSSRESAKKSARQLTRPSARVEPRGNRTSAAQSGPRTRGGLEVTGAEGDDSASRRKRASMKGKQIGQLLVKAEAITDEHLNRALDLQEKEGGMLGQILVRLEICTRADIGSALRKQRTITTVELANVTFDPEATCLLDKEFCVQNRLIPFEKIGNQLCVAMANVLDTQAKNDIKEKTQLQLKAFDAAWPDIQSAIDREVTGEKKEPAKPIAEQAQAEESQSIEDLVIELPGEDEMIDFDNGEIALEEVSSKSSSSDTTRAQAKPAASAEAAPALIIEDDIVSAPVLDIEPDEVDLIDTPEPVAAAQAKSRESSAMTKALPAGSLEAIPMDEAYFNAIVQDGKVTAENCWMARHVKDLPLSPLPASCIGDKMCGHS